MQYDKFRIGFIGAGKVGTSLGRYFFAKGLCIAGYYSKSASSAREAAELTGSHAYSNAAALVRAADLVFLTVPDAAIPTAWEGIRTLPLAGKRILHCSGALSAAVLAGIEETGAQGYSLHPLLSMHDKHSSYKELAGAWFTIEGANIGKNTIKGGATDEIEALIRSLGNRIAPISSDSKPLYHAAAVTVSNFVNALAMLGTELLLSCGLEEEFAQSAWHALFLGNAHNILRDGPVQSLTGPMERGDAPTVRAHMERLNEEERQLYRLLALRLVRMAKEKHPGRDYSALERELRA